MTRSSMRTRDSMVDERVRSWQLAQHEPPSSTRRRVAPRPIVTVSREAASGGTDLGRALAERLGYSFWDQELVHEIARLAKVPEQLVASLDENRRTAIEEFVSGLIDARATHDDYVAQLHRVVLALVERGGAVVVGRGAQFIVRPENSLRVRVVAPFAQRVAFVMDREGLSQARAEARVREVEETRRSFTRKTFGVDVTDPSYYDVVINLGTVSIEQAVEVLAATYAAKFPGHELAEPLRRVG
jgi:cytidylate kinase